MDENTLIQLFACLVLRLEPSNLSLELFKHDYGFDQHVWHFCDLTSKINLSYINVILLSFCIGQKKLYKILFLTWFYDENIQR